MIEDNSGEREIIWGSKAKFAIEEYVFARYYMYQNVYLHKTTRGFEAMLQALWRRARQLHDAGEQIDLEPAIERFWSRTEPLTEDYLAIEEFTVLNQIQRWRASTHASVKDLADRFLNRIRFKMVEAPSLSNQLDNENQEWEQILREAVKAKVAYADVDMYVLKDELKPKYHQPYFPEREDDEQSVKNAIRILDENGDPNEASRLMPRMRPLTEPPTSQVRYYVPEDCYKDVLRLRNDLSKA